MMRTPLIQCRTLCNHLTESNGSLFFSSPDGMDPGCTCLSGTCQFARMTLCKLQFIWLSPPPTDPFFATFLSRNILEHACNRHTKAPRTPGLRNPRTCRRNFCWFKPKRLLERQLKSTFIFMMFDCFLPL